MLRWIANAAGGTSQRLKPGPATIRSLDSRPAMRESPEIKLLLARAGSSHQSSAQGTGDAISLPDHVRKSMPRVVRQALLTATLAAAIACSGKSQSASSAPAPSAAPVPHPAATDSAPAAADTSWMKSDSAGRTVTLSLVVSKPAGSPSALINGYRSGRVQIEVPVRWTVKWNW